MYELKKEIENDVKETLSRKSISRVENMNNSGEISRVPSLKRMNNNNSLNDDSNDFMNDTTVGRKSMSMTQVSFKYNETEMNNILAQAQQQNDNFNSRDLSLEQLQKMGTNFVFFCHSQN